jgi:hypothetical protein
MGGKRSGFESVATLPRRSPMQTLVPQRLLRRREEAGGGQFLAGILLLLVAAFIISMAVPWI